MRCVASADAPFAPPGLLVSLFVTDLEDAVLTAPSDPAALLDVAGVWGIWRRVLFAEPAL